MKDRKNSGFHIDSGIWKKPRNGNVPSLIQIRLFRAIKGWTQEKMAAEAGVPVDYVILFEGGISSVAEVRKWAKEMYDFYRAGDWILTCVKEGADFGDDTIDCEEARAVKLEEIVAAGGEPITAEEFYRRDAELDAIHDAGGLQ